MEIFLPCKTEKSLAIGFSKNSLTLNRSIDKRPKPGNFIGRFPWSSSFHWFKFKFVRSQMVFIHLLHSFRHFHVLWIQWGKFAIKLFNMLSDWLENAVFYFAHVMLLNISRIRLSDGYWNGASFSYFATMHYFVIVLVTAELATYPSCIWKQDPEVCWWVLSIFH